MSWKRIDLDGPDAPSLTKLQTQFEAIFVLSNEPELAAMYSDSASMPSAVYFSPQAAKIASMLLTAHRASPCEKPDDVRLLVGHDHASRKLGIRVSS